MVDPVATTAITRVAPEVWESLSKLGPTAPLKQPQDHPKPSGRHSKGHTVAQSPRDKKTKRNRLKRQRQEYMSYIVDHGVLNG